MADWEAGDLVMCRTALGDEVIGTATSGIVMGRDMQVVWIDFGDRHCLPWPAEAVRAGERIDGSTATSEGGTASE